MLTSDIPHSATPWCRRRRHAPCRTTQSGSGCCPDPDSVRRGLFAPARAAAGGASNPCSRSNCAILALQAEKFYKISTECHAHFSAQADRTIFTEQKPGGNCPSASAAGTTGFPAGVLPGKRFCSMQGSAPLPKRGAPDTGCAAFEPPGEPAGAFPAKLPAPLG